MAGYYPRKYALETGDTEFEEGIVLFSNHVHRYWQQAESALSFKLILLLKSQQSRDYCCTWTCDRQGLSSRDPSPPLAEWTSLGTVEIHEYIKLYHILTLLGIQQ